MSNRNQPTIGLALSGGAARGMAHGNLPVQGNPFAEEEEETQESAVAQSRRTQPRAVPPDLRTYPNTRTDVDARGRRTLVNDMR